MANRSAVETAARRSRLLVCGCKLRALTAGCTARRDGGKYEDRDRESSPTNAEHQRRRMMLRQKRHTHVRGSALGCHLSASARARAQISYWSPRSFALLSSRDTRYKTLSSFEYCKESSSSEKVKDHMLAHVQGVQGHLVVGFYDAKASIDIACLLYSFRALSDATRMQRRTSWVSATAGDVCSMTF